MHYCKHDDGTKHQCTCPAAKDHCEDIFVHFFTGYTYK